MESTIQEGRLSLECPVEMASEAVSGQISAAVIR
jgi:hypothetical protein